MEDLSLYVHIPFCKSKCYYCDFNSYSNKEHIQHQYIDSLIGEMDQRVSVLENYKIRSIYIGGGTPTYLSLESLEKLLVNLKKYTGPEVEYSCEANPGTLTKEKLLLLRDGGVNRLSIGLQSWNNSILKKLGRIHTVEGFIENYNLARTLGFKNINVDLMFSIQGQTLDDLSNTLDNVIALQPEHISCYSLIIEEGTLFYEMVQNGQLCEMDEDYDRAMYYLACKKLKDSGYIRYEISNFAKPGFECRHNITYWDTEDYLGLGAGAHSLIRGARFSNEPLPERYIQNIKESKSPVSWKEELSLDDRISEFMFMGLRMTKGVSFQSFKERFKSEMMDVFGKQIDKMSKNGLLDIKEGRIMLTDLGVDLSNQVFVEFVN